MRDFGVGKVVLVFSPRPGAGWFRGFAPCRAFRFSRFLFPGLHFGLIFRLLGFIARLRPSFQNGLGLRQLGQAFLPQRNFIGDNQSGLRVALLGLFPTCEQLVNFGAQLSIQFQQPLVTHGFAFGGVGVNFRPVQTQITQLQHPRRLGQHEHLHKQLFELRQKRLAKMRQGVMIGMKIPRDVSKRQALVAGLLQLARAKHARGVAVEQQAQQDFGGDGLSAPLAIARVQGRQIQLGYHIHNEAGQMIRRHGFFQAHRELEGTGVISGSECAGHTVSLAPLFCHAAITISPTNC